MILPSLGEIMVLISGSLLTGGVGLAIVEGVFRKPERDGIRERETAVAEKERALAEQLRGGAPVEHIKLWMKTNERLMASNERLERSNERLQRSGEKMGRELLYVKQVAMSLVEVIEIFIPMLRDVHDNSIEMQKLDGAITRVRSVTLPP